MNTYISILFLAFSSLNLVLAQGQDSLMKDTSIRGFFLEIPRPILTLTKECLNEEDLDTFMDWTGYHRGKWVFDNYRGNYDVEYPDSIIYAKLHAKVSEILPTIIYSFKNLHILTLEYHFGQNHFDKLHSLACLQEISANYAGFEIFPTGFYNLPNLKKLELNGNKINTVPSEIFESPTLRFLSLRNQKDTLRLPSQIINPGSLAELDLSNSALLTIPLGFFNQPNLEILNLEHCNLSNLPSDLSAMKKLRTITLNDNPIEELPNSFEELDNLRIIRLSRTKLKKFPEVLFRLKNIQRIYLTGTEFTKNGDQREAIYNKFIELGKKNITIFW